MDGPGLRVRHPVTRPCGCPGRDTGSGTVVVVAVIAVLVAGAALLALVVRGQAHTATARAAADLAALAAAEAVALPDGVVLAGSAGPGTAAACERAREVARRNGARLTSCDVGVTGVVVTARTPGAWPGEASARAGPRSAVPGPWRRPPAGSVIGGGR